HGKPVSAHKLMFQTGLVRLASTRKSPKTEQSTQLVEGETCMPALVLFGGGGDLALRMLLPSLYFLEHDDLLPSGLKIIAAARSEESRDQYLARVREWVQPRAETDDQWSEKAFDHLAGRIDYLAVDATDPESLRALKNKTGDEDVTYFLAVSPSL